MCVFTYPALACQPASVLGGAEATGRTKELGPAVSVDLRDGKQDTIGIRLAGFQYYYSYDPVQINGRSSSIHIWLQDNCNVIIKAFGEHLPPGKNDFKSLITYILL